MTAAGYRLVAVPDIFTADGAVLHGQLASVNWLRERRNKVWNEARTLFGAHNGPFTRAQQRHWDLLRAELDYWDARIAEALGRR